MSGSGFGTSRFGAGLLGAIFVAILAVLFVLLWLVLSPSSQFNAILAMGIVALLMGLVSYLAQSLSRDPSIQRSIGWGLGAMGFVLLFADLWAGPPTRPSLTGQVLGTLVVLIVLFVTVALARWRFRGVDATARREEQRAAWDQRPAVSAFDYATAKAPGTSSGGAPPPSTGPGKEA